MPFEGEFAKYGPLSRVARNPRIQELIGSWEILERKIDELELPVVHKAEGIDKVGWNPDWVVAIDGSHLEVPVRNGFPGAEAAYITVASVMLDVKKLKDLDANRPVDPVEFRKTEQADSLDGAFPGANVVMKNDDSSVSSLRRVLKETLASMKMDDDSESLLDTYEALLKYKPSTQDQKCPYFDECGKLYVREAGEYVCSCDRKKPLYSTDATRIHEGMNEVGTNGTMFGEIMQLVERLWLVHILRTIEKKQWLSSLTRVAFVIDGPLAVFSFAAWLSQAIQKELARLNQKAREANAQDILIVGIEKTGQFVDHFAMLDKKKDGSMGRLENGSVLLLTDKYIKDNVVFSKSEKPHGQDTYFGRKVFYKTRKGAKLVATLPFYTEFQRNRLTAEPGQFPRLADVISLLDQIGSVRYPNSVTPLISANSEAAIPLNIGTKVLAKIAKDLIKEKK